MISFRDLITLLDQTYLDIEKSQEVPDVDQVFAQLDKYFANHSITTKDEVEQCYNKVTRITTLLADRKTMAEDAIRQDRAQHEQHTRYVKTLHLQSGD